MKPNEGWEMELKPGYYKTRDGRKVHIVYTNGHDALAIGYIDSGEHKHEMYWFRPDGKLAFRGGFETSHDLVAEWRELIKVSGWVNVYDDESDDALCRTLYPTRGAANKNAGDQGGYSIYVEGVEGKGP